MPFLRFDPHYDLFMTGLEETFNEFPFRENELVSMPIYAIPPYLVESREDESLRYNARFETLLNPLGEEIPEEDVTVCTVTNLTKEGGSYQLKFLNDEENVLVVLFTDEDKEVYAQFKDKIRSVSVSLRVSLVDKREKIWIARLSPFGEEVNGLILSEVEIVE